MMPVKPLSKTTLWKVLSLLALLVLLLPSFSMASAGKAAPPAPPSPPSPAAAPTPPPAPEPPEPPGGWLGVVLSDSDGEEGVTVTDVREGSPAEKAGLEEGDRILEMDGRKVGRTRDVRRVMRDLEPGDTVQIRIQRKGQAKTLTATVGKPPERMFPGRGPLWFGDNGPGPLELGLLGISRNYLGVRVQSMTEDLRAYFKAPRGRGVLVSRVEEDTPAAEAGLRAGDVIIAVDGKGISDRSDIARALADREPGDRIPLKIVRDGSERTLDVKIGERRPPRRQGDLLLPEGDELDLERLHLPPLETDELVKDSLEKAMEEAQRAMREMPERQAELAAALQQSRFTRQQTEVLRQQVEEAMEQAREALHRASDSMKDAPL